MSISLRPLSDKLLNRWDAFVAQSNEGTIFHRLDFLAYHQDRFRAQEEHVVFLEGDSLFGVMPLAIFEEEGGTLVGRSPYGASYGGPIFGRTPNYSDSMAVVQALIRHLLDLGVDKLTLTLPISCCYQKYSETFRLALLENGFKCINRDISSAVLLESLDLLLESRSRNALRKAESLGVHVVPDAPLADFWPLLEKTYQKIGTHPTHRLEDLSYLSESLEGAIFFDVAYVDSRPVAGICIFEVNSRVRSSFYLASDEDFQHTQALSLVVFKALKTSQQKGYNWFDFGTSSRQQIGQGGIFRFKEAFGAIGLFREQYQWARMG